MRNRVLMVFGLTMVVMLIGGCEAPNQIDLQVDFYSNNGYLYSVPIVETNQLVIIPLEATVLVEQFSSVVAEDSSRREFDYTVTATDNADGFAYVLDEGHADAGDVIYVSKLVRDTLGQPLVSEFQSEVSAVFILPGPYHDETLWTAHASFTAIPEIPEEK